MSEPPPSFTCPRCRMTSYNPMDVLNGYCGNCDDTTALEILIALSEVAAELDDDEALPPLLERNDGER